MSLTSCTLFVADTNNIITNNQPVYCAGVLHNDLKPENIFLAKKDSLHPNDLVIGDLGLANTIAFYDSGSWDQAGTPGFMAPEVLGKNQHSPKTDVFSLGVILFFMVTGMFPFASNSSRVLQLHCNACFCVST